MAAGNKNSESTYADKVRCRRWVNGEGILKSAEESACRGLPAISMFSKCLNL